MRRLIIYSLCLISGYSAQASTRPEIYNGATTFSPACAVSGLPEASIRLLSKAICAEAAALLDPQKDHGVEALAIGDARLNDPDRLVYGIRATVQKIDGKDYILFTTKKYRYGMSDGWVVPGAASLAPFDPATLAITPEIRAALKTALLY